MSELRATIEPEGEGTWLVTIAAGDDELVYATVAGERERAEEVAADLIERTDPPAP